MVSKVSSGVQTPLALVVGAARRRPRWSREALISRRGNCWDKAPSEGCFGSLKTEHVHVAKYQTLEKAEADLLDWLRG